MRLRQRPSPRARKLRSTFSGKTGLAQTLPFGKWDSFDACVVDMMRSKEEGGQGYDEETARKVCGKLQAQLEGFGWAGSIRSLKGVTNLIHGKALHPIRTVHPDEWPQIREYLEEELQKSAHTLSGKPLLLDHITFLKGEVLEASYEDGAIEYIAKLDDQDTLGKIQDGKIKHCSVEFDWDILQNVNGVAPRGITFTGLSLLEQLQPGDPKSSVELWESIIKQWHPEAQIHVPIEKVPENLNLEEFLEYQLIKNRTVIFHGEVYESICKEASRRLEYLASLNKNPIRVILNSVGGEVYHGLLVFDTIKSIIAKGIPVTCEARGLAASMGCILLQAGSRRHATEHTRFLIHEVSSFAWGKASEVEEQSEELKKVNDMLKKILSERTGKSPEEIEKIWHKKDVWMSTEEALKFGLIDEIVKEPRTLEESLIGITTNTLSPNPAGVQASPTPPKEAKILEKKNPIWERIWDRNFINDLPDAAFAGIRSGGEKDEKGKTVPRNLRDLPHHRADGSLDLSHLRNALGRAPQMKGVSDEYRDSCIAHLQRHAKAAGVGVAAEESKVPFKHAWKEQNEVEFQVAPEPTMDELIESIEDVVEQINARLDAIEARLPSVPAQETVTSATTAQGVPTKPETTATSAKPTLPEALISPTGSQPSDLISRKEILAMIEAIIPPPQVVFSHGQTGGFKCLVENIQRVKREIEKGEN